MLQTDQRLPAVDSLGNVKANADGSYDVYFGPKAPEGVETTGSRPLPARAENTIFRLYGPLQPFYDKTWKPGDPELVQ